MTNESWEGRVVVNRALILSEWAGAFLSLGKSEFVNKEFMI